jgi:hypothetical protein
MRIILKKDEIYLIQNAYADQLAKDYEIKTERRVNQISLSSSCVLIEYEDEID